MKNHAYIVQIIVFSIILAFFAVPPFFVNAGNFNQESFTTWSFPFYQIGIGICAVIFYEFYIKDRLDFKYNNAIKLMNLSIQFVFVLCLLFCNSLLLNFIGTCIPDFSSSIIASKPNTFLGILFLILNFTGSACYEEILYRSYIPDALLSIFKIKEKDSVTKQIIFRYFIEIAGMMLFAFAHIYGGPLSVINAAIAHCILRFFYVKTKNVYVNIASHSLYNILICFIF